MYVSVFDLVMQPTDEVGGICRDLGFGSAHTHVCVKHTFPSLLTENVSPCTVKKIFIDLNFFLSHTLLLFVASLL